MTIWVLNLPSSILYYIKIPDFWRLERQPNFEPVSLAKLATKSLPVGLKSCPNSKQSPNLVTLGAASTLKLDMQHVVACDLRGAGAVNLTKLVGSDQNCQFIKAISLFKVSFLVSLVQSKIFCEQKQPRLVVGHWNAKILPLTAQSLKIILI